MGPVGDGGVGVDQAVIQKFTESITSDTVSGFQIGPTIQGGNRCIQGGCCHFRRYSLNFAANLIIPIRNTISKNYQFSEIVACTGRMPHGVFGNNARTL